MHSIHLRPRKVTIVLAGESVNDARGIRGGDTSLSPAGAAYASAAARAVLERQEAEPGRRAPVVMSGTLKRYEQMVALLSESCDRVLQLPALNELGFGKLEGLRAGRLRDALPEEYEAREADKLNYRYPGVGGQSYHDKISQLREVILAIESSSRDSLVVCDVAVARVLLGYFEAVPTREVPDVAVPCGLLELSRTHSGFERTSVPVQAGRVSMLGGLHAHEGADREGESDVATTSRHETVSRSRRTDSTVLRSQ